MSHKAFVALLVGSSALDCVMRTIGMITAYLANYHDDASDGQWRTVTSLEVFSLSLKSRQSLFDKKIFNRK